MRRRGGEGEKCRSNRLSVCLSVRLCVRLSITRGRGQTRHCHLSIVTGFISISETILWAFTYMQYFLSFPEHVSRKDDTL